MSRFVPLLWHNAPDSNTRRSQWPSLQIVLVTSNNEHWPWHGNDAQAYAYMYLFSSATNTLGVFLRFLLSMFPLLCLMFSPAPLQDPIPSPKSPTSCAILSLRFPHDNSTHLLALWVHKMSSITGFLIFSRFAIWRPDFSFYKHRKGNSLSYPPSHRRFRNINKLAHSFYQPH